MDSGVFRRGGRSLIGYIAAIIALIAQLLAYVPPEPAEVEPVWSTFEATAYTARCDGCIGITKTGIDVRRTIVDEDGRRIIAVDPRVIPLGTAVEIRLADGAIIEGVAEDVGGDIKGARIDVLHATYNEAVTFGRQDVEVRVINENEAEEMAYE